MAKITVTIEGATIGTATIITEYDETNSDRFVSWLTAHYGTDEEGEPRDLAGMAQSYWNAVKAGTHANIERWEAEEAKKAAAAAVPPMVNL
jgi:hypothetical protein